MVQEVSAPRATGPAPQQSESEQEPAADPAGPAAPAVRVPLDRLLTVVALSPAQASLVAVRLLEAVAGSEPDVESRWAVTLGRSGDVEVAPAEPGAGAPVAGHLSQLTHHARRLRAHPTTDQLVLLRRLEEAAAAPDLDPEPRAGTLERALVEVLGADAPARLTAQLADLVGAFSHMAPGLSAPVGAPAVPGPDWTAAHRTAPPQTAVPTAPPTASPTAARRTAAPRTATSRFSPRRARRRGRVRGRRHLPARRATLVALLLVVTLAGSGYVLLRRADDTSAGADGRDPATAAPTERAPSDASPKPAERPSPRQRPGIRTLAPRQAGAITGVELEQAGTCSAGTLCAVTVTARFRPAPTAQAVTWRVGTATSCTGRIAWSPPVSVIAQPGWTSVYASSSVPVPQGPSVALVATTTAPARAQSPPVPVTGSSLRC